MLKWTNTSRWAAAAALAVGLAVPTVAAALDVRIAAQAVLTSNPLVSPDSTTLVLDPVAAEAHANSADWYGLDGSGYGFATVGKLAAAVSLGANPAARAGLTAADRAALASLDFGVFVDANGAGSTMDWVTATASGTRRMNFKVDRSISQTSAGDDSFTRQIAEDYASQVGLDFTNGPQVQVHTGGSYTDFSASLIIVDYTEFNYANLTILDVISHQRSVIFDDDLAGGYTMEDPADSTTFDSAVYLSGDCAACGSGDPLFHESREGTTSFSRARNYSFDFTFTEGHTYALNMVAFCGTDLIGEAYFTAGNRGTCDASHSTYWNGITDEDGNADPGLRLISASGFDYRYASPLSPDPAAVPPTGGVPEPSEWALLIAGFGLVGLTLRRRTARLAA